MAKKFAKCPSCGAKIKKGQKECLYCKTAIVDDVEEIVIKQQNEEEKINSKVIDYTRRIVKRRELCRIFGWGALALLIVAFYFVCPILMMIFGFLKCNLSIALFVVVGLLLVGFMIFGVFFSIQYFKFYIRKIKMYTEIE